MIPSFGVKTPQTAEKRLEQLVKLHGTKLLIRNYYSFRALRRIEPNSFIDPIINGNLRGECRVYPDGFEAVIRAPIKYDGKKKYVIDAFLHLTNREVVIEYTTISSHLK